MSFDVMPRLRSRAVFEPVRPGLRRGPSPSRPRRSVHATPLDRWVMRCRTWLQPTALQHDATWLAGVKARMHALELPGASRHEVGLEQLVMRLRSRGHDHDSIDESLAHAVLVARRVLNLDPHDVQLLAVRELLQGRFVEMATGEGKTLTMALAAAVAALDGTPVHVLTASDYLARRDADTLAPLYDALGLCSRCVLPAMSDTDRRDAYRADVVHVAGKQVAFDWMRDNVAHTASPQRLSTRLGRLAGAGGRLDSAASEPLLRGLCLALVDEADSLLIDEARTPLILAAPVAETGLRRHESVFALTLARLLHEGVDFELLPGARMVTLTAAGEEALARLAKRVEGTWRSERYRDERVRHALAVLHCWHRDRDYVVRDDRVELVDPHTGRTLPDRRLHHGLHALLELKERCSTTPENDAVASMPFQRFFLSYVRLAGMSGTLSEVRSELACVYGVDVVCVPTASPTQLYTAPMRVLPTVWSQHMALVQEVRQCRAAGRPVLVGTRSVEQSDRASDALTAHSIPHRVLSATQDADEAAVVAEAGRAGQVTVATNMAGRGTDIRLDPGVDQSGGLHVVSLAFNDSCRLDRQLAGRAARQGDHGSYRRLVSLDDQPLTSAMPLWCTRLLHCLSTNRPPRAEPREEPPRKQGAFVDQVSGPLAAICRHLLRTSLQMLLANVPQQAVRLAQRRIERQHAAERLAALDAQKRLSALVAIGGTMDNTA